MLIYIGVGLAVGLLLYLLTDWLIASVLLGAATALHLAARDLAG